MNERVVEQRLERWYANEVGGMTAPESLRASVAGIPYATRRGFAFGPSTAWALVMLLAMLMALAIGALVTGALRPLPPSLSTEKVLITADNRVIAVDVGTGVQHDIANGTLIALSPDRSQFIRAAPIYPFDCFVTTFAGTDERRLDACGPNASWSPDGGKVLFYDGGFFVADVASGHVTRLPWKESFKDTGTGSWSPDGGKIAIPTSGGLLIADGDGHQLGRIPTPDYCFGPKWSPDGRSVVFWTLDNGWAAVNTEVAGAQFGKQLTDGPGLFPAWSPDGTRIAYIVGYALRVVDRDGRNDRLLDAHAYPYVPGLQWSPDGSRILYGSNRGDAGTLAGPIMVVDVVSGESHAVFDVASFNYAW